MRLHRLRRSNGGSTQRRGKHRATTDPTYETRIQQALHGLLSGLYSTPSEAAKAHNVSRSTLNDRRLGHHRSRSEFQARRQLLTPAQEDVLADWCATGSSAANPIHPIKLRAQVQDLSGQLPSRNWHRGFLKRHPNLFLGRPQGLDPKRAQNFNRATVSEFFDMQKQLISRYGHIPPQHRWNTDEKGNQMGGGRKNLGMRYIYAEGDDRYRIHSDNLELVTILECVNASGDKMPPWFVHTLGPSPDIRDLEGRVGGVSFSQSGWTDREIAAHWLEHHFVPEAEKCRVHPNMPIVLLLDGHDSHESPEFKAVAYKHNIIIHAFPSKTTHKLQPLDVGVFASLQRAWTKHCDKRLAEGVEITRYNFIHEYMSVHHVITPDLVQKAFKNTGIYPLNPSIFSDKDFAPSQLSSNTAHVPASFPPEIPSSPILLPDDLMETDQDDLDFDPMEVENDSSDVESVSAQECGMDTGVASVDFEEENFSPPPISPPTHAHHSADQETLSSMVAEQPRAARTSTDCLDYPNSSNGVLRVTRSTTFASANPPFIMLTDAQMMKLSDDELRHELRRAYKKILTTHESEHMLMAQLEASNAHCTLTKRALSDSRLQLDNAKKKRPRQSVKLRSRFVTIGELKEDFEKAESERREKEEAEAQKQAKKKTDDAARHCRIEQDIRNKTFEPLSTFRRKDDFITLAGALGISREGTIEELKTRIKEYITDPSHADIAQNSRFAGLLQPVVKSRSRNPAQDVTHSELTIPPPDSVSQSFNNESDQSYPHLTQAFPAYDTTHGYNLSHPSTYSTYNYFSHIPYPIDTSQVASSSNLDRQPQFGVNAGIYSPSSSYYHHYSS